MSWLGVGSGSDKSNVLVESCARDIGWYTYTTLRASEAAQPDMSLELWTELQMEMSASSSVSVEQALSVCYCTHAHSLAAVMLHLPSGKKLKAKAQVLGIAPLNMRSTCQRRFTIAEVMTDQHWL